MKKIIAEVSYGAFFRPFRGVLTGYLKMLGLFTQGTFKTLNFELMNLFRSEEEIAKARVRFDKQMRSIRDSLHATSKSLNRDAGFETVLLYAVAPQYAIAQAGLNIGAHLLSPYRDADREKQVEFLEDYGLSALIDTEDSKYLAARNAYIKDGSAEGIKSFVNGKRDRTIYRANRTVHRETEYTVGRFHPDRFESIYFGNLREGLIREAEEKDNKEKGEDLISPLFQYIQKEYGNTVVKSAEEYIAKIEKIQEDSDTLSKELMQAQSLDEFISIIKGKEIEAFDIDEYLNSLDKTVDELIKSPEFNPEEYVMKKHKKIQEKLKNDKKAFKEALRVDVFDANWQVAKNQLDKFFKESKDNLKTDFEKEFDVDVWKNYTGDSKAALKIQKIVLDLEDKLKE